MTTELPCCQGLPEHTHDDDCLLHRRGPFDLDNEEDRRALAKQIAREVYDAGGFLRPGVQLFRPERDELVLSQEDIRRLLGDEES